MITPTPSSHLPRAYAALEAFPALHAEVSASLQRQAAHVVACLGRAIERTRLLATIESAATDPRGGLVVVEGLPGSGVTSLMAALAARHPMPLWLADADPAGLPALYAQIVALRRPNIALIDPALLTDPSAFARLLTEAAGQPGDPLTLLIDMPAPDAPPLRPDPPFIPNDLPPGVTLIVGCAPGYPLPDVPRLRLRLPDDDPDMDAVAASLLAAARCDPATAARLIGAADGNLLYLDLAAGWLTEGLIDPTSPPNGLAGLLDCWWQQLDSVGRRMALLLAAAGEPLPLPVAAELLGSDPEPLLLRWESLRLIDLTMQATRRVPDHVSAPPLLLATFAHSALRGFLARSAPDELEHAHGDLAALAMSGLTDGASGAASLTGSYLVRQAARHAALGPVAERAARLSRVTARERMRAHERQASLNYAYSEAAWEMWAASDGPPLRTVRAAALAGTLATRARTLNADSAVEALVTGLERGGREATLKRVIELVERLPDGMGKAQILRRLGEVCYGARMRASAMRLLSRALDLEANPVSRGWREQREQLFVALSSAALSIGKISIALSIGERIEHLERRAMVETQVTRHLIAVGDLDRARRVAHGIVHESMAAWARAEVAVALTRAGDARGAMILEEITLETVAAWAQIELACDLAAHDDHAALARIDALPSPGQRDRGLARLAHALALAEKDGDALAAAEQIRAVEVRVAALLDLRLTLDGLVAMLALERATSDIDALTGDDRAPLLASLAAAHAAIGRRDDALQITEQLPEGEERDRALAKVAVAIAQSGDYPAAQVILVRLDDDDERDWAKDEIARILASSGKWEESLTLVAMIGADDQRARTSADLAIDRARAGDPLSALDYAATIDAPADRARALTLIAPLLVASGHGGEALAVDEQPGLLASAETRGRYLAAVAAALAAAGRYDDAAAVTARILRPIDRARAGIALAQALVQLPGNLCQIVDASRPHGFGGRWPVAGHRPPATGHRIVDTEAVTKPERNVQKAVLAPSNRARAESALGAALRSATIGREESLRALELTAPTLAILGGGELLAAAAAVVDEHDSWM